MKRKNVNRWDLPGWRFEPSYSSRTLVGDWLEERKTRFTKGTMTCVTTNMKDYKTHDTPCYTRDWREMCDNRITQQSLVLHFAWKQLNINQENGTETHSVGFQSKLIYLYQTNLRDLALAEKKDKKLAVFPTPQKSPLKTPKLMYRHFNKTNY
ncbi:uncharacterized protein LOC124445197 [Xenia sp. Carnegie-2017]|uniref:uncharacterized protein LOC124445197 n=1 Tax=Xenia sp. Carnegie-2017 TaxID=2897299 RepID=UPI001F04381C|nr:uncharacterized protein LOC124445197 [Xenia sp. Carnegie-2017]